MTAGMGIAMEWTWDQERKKAKKVNQTFFRIGKALLIAFLLLLYYTRNQ